MIKYLRSILGSETKLLEVIKEELTAIKDKYTDKRRTQMMKEEHAQIEVDESEFVVVEECTILMTRAGNLKRMSQKALQKGMEAEELEEKLQPVLDVYKRQVLNS